MRAEKGSKRPPTPKERRELVKQFERYFLREQAADRQPDPRLFLETHDVRFRVDARQLYTWYTTYQRERYGSRGRKVGARS